MLSKPLSPRHLSPLQQSRIRGRLRPVPHPASLVPRARLIDRVTEALSQGPGMLLLGPPKAGTTTIARLVTQQWTGPRTLFDLRGTAARDALHPAPERILRHCEGLVVIDEIQHMPQLLATVRGICDEPNRGKVFLVLGQSNDKLIEIASGTLAKGFPVLHVDGLSLADVGVERQNRLWMRGGFPNAFCAEPEGEWRWWIQSYLGTFLERALHSTRSRIQPDTLARFWTMLAHRQGRAWNAAGIGRSMQAGPKVANRYRNLLAGAGMLRVLPPWLHGTGKRLVRSSRVYICDSGILHTLLGLDDPIQLAAHPAHFPSWKGFALQQTLIAHGDHDAWFYRTQRGAGLDLLLLRDGRHWGFEFTCSDAPRTTRSMHIVKDDVGLEHLWVIYPGDLEYPLGDAITAWPLKRIWELRLRASAPGTP